ncbi:putative membrane protein [Mycobacterium sp. MAA66]|jgi:uncharacterized membrane protein|uniref:hypothetical protein n=1 Tax=Mycobacterium sp. MAA66 TaxID=3156297 RepID=UPI003513D3A7
MARIKYLAPLVMMTVAVSTVGTAPAQAQPGSDQSCQFSAGSGPHSACASAPEDDYPDIFWPGSGYGYGTFPRGGMPGIWRGF